VSRGPAALAQSEHCAFVAGGSTVASEAVESQMGLASIHRRVSWCERVVK
jgi:hypothetical protein